MKKTFANFIKLSESYPDQNATIEEAVRLYQQTKDAMCLPYIFCKAYPLLVWRTNTYFNLTEEDKSSFCLEELQKVMKDYDFDNSKHASVKTLLDTYVTNRLRRETESLGYDKRKCNKDASDYADIENDSKYTEDEYNSVELLESLKTMNLTGNELRYCEIIVKTPADKVKDTDIAKTLGISSAAINYIKNSLSKKVNFSFS